MKTFVVDSTIKQNKGNKIDKMRLFSCGFNLYNQLNSINKNDHILKGFQCTFQQLPITEIVDILFIEIKHSFSFLVFNVNLIEIYINNKVIQHKISDFQIIQATANDNFILLLNSCGELFKISSADYFRHVESLANSNFLDREINDRFKLISSSSTLTVFYTDNRLLYNGTGEKIANFQNQIVQIKTGKEHCLLLDLNGNVYSFGNGSRGQLGLGHLDTEPHPQLIEALAGIRICKIAAGGWHSAALSIDGDLYIWGWNGNGQLGLYRDTITIMALPHLVDIDGLECFKTSDSGNINITDVDCGARHTIILFNNKHIFGCGWNKYNQLTNGEQEQYNSFVPLQDCAKEDNKRIICGDWNTTYYISN